MKKTGKSSKNVEQAVPFTAAQQVSMAQGGHPGFGYQIRVNPNPMDVLAQALAQQQMQVQMLGKNYTGPGGAMDKAAAFDAQKTKMQQRTRMGSK